MTLLAMLHAGLVLPTAFGPRSAADGWQRSLPAPMPGFDAPPARALPRPFEEELESIAADRRYRLHKRVARGAHGEVWRAVRSDDPRYSLLSWPVLFPHGRVLRLRPEGPAAQWPPRSLFKSEIS